MSNRVFDTSGQFIIKNAVFDVIMPDLSPNAFKVLCVAIRQTWGWVAEPGGNPNDRREWDRISYSQFMEKAGIGGRSTVSRAVKECLEAGYLIRHQVGTVKGTGKPIYAYALNTDYELASSPKTEPGGASSPKTGLEPSPKTGLEPSPKTGLTNTKEYKQHDDDGWTNIQRQSLTILTEAGADVTQTVKAVARRRTPDDIEAMLEAARGKPGLTNPLGWAIAQLRDGEKPPRIEEPGNGKDPIAATCPVCYRVMPIGMICEDCGRCLECCEC